MLSGARFLVLTYYYIWKNDKNQIKNYKNNEKIS